MAEVSGSPPARTGLRDLALRYQNSAMPVLAVLLGLVVFPLAFTALLAHDVRLGGKISLVDAVWLVLALAACVIILRARARLGQIASGAADRLLASFPESDEPSQASGASGGSPSLVRKANVRGQVVAQALLDLIFLLVVQAILRTPLVGLISGVAPEAWVDGVYVVVVVVVALALLLTVNRAGQPLVERLTWLGLNQLVPTAGFATTSSVAATFTARLATTSSRPSTSNRSSSNEPAPARLPSGASAEAPTMRAEAETLVAQPDQHAPSLVAEATIVAPGSFVEATVVAPSEPAAPILPVASEQPDLSSATIVAVEPDRPAAAAPVSPPAAPPSNPVGPTETIVVSEHPAAEPVANKGKDELK